MADNDIRDTRDSEIETPEGEASESETTTATATDESGREAESAEGELPEAESERFARINAFTHEVLDEDAVAAEVESPRARKRREREEAMQREPVFPPEVYSSANLPGARRSRRKTEEDDLDLRIEGLLFVTDVPLTGREISTLLNVPLKVVMETLRQMIKSFSRRRSALELRERIRRGTPAFIIDLKPDFRPDVQSLAAPDLAPRYLETLSLIALNQPMDQSRLVRERGSRIYDHVRVLVERGLVHKHPSGQTYALRTTPRFSSEFGLSSNPKDLKAMLAREMTPEERDLWETYKTQKREEEAERRAEREALAAERAKKVYATFGDDIDMEAEIEDELGDDWDDEPRLVKETRAYEKAVAEAAGSLETETEARDRSEDSDALVSGTGVAEDDSSGSGSWLRSEGDERSAKEVVKELLKSSPIDDDDDDDDDDEDRSDSTRLTRFQRLMLTLKARQSSRR